MPNLTWDINDIPPLRDAMKAYSDWGEYLGADYGVTELITPPRIVHLRKRHKQEIESKPKELEKLVAAFRGNAVHTALEFNLRKFKSTNPGCGYYIEQKVWDKILDRKISGKLDVYQDGILYDFKTTSTFKFIKGDYEEYEQQLNIYAYMLKPYNLQVRSNKIILIFTDWNKAGTYKEDYPKQPFVMVEMQDVWSHEKQEQFIHDRIKTMIRNETLPDEELDYCTIDEMWAMPDSYAVYPEGRTTGKAVRVLTSMKQAEFYIKRNVNRIGNATIVHRPSVRARCENWCEVSNWCDQYHNYVLSREYEADVPQETQSQEG